VFLLALFLISKDREIFELDRANTLINVSEVSYTYDMGTPEALDAVKAVSFKLEPGQHLAILGRNGSGKSTLSRLLNGLLLPREGRVLVLDMDTRKEEDIWPIRSQLGMVFQNPDNQIVATTVEEDVAFGLENLGVPGDLMVQRVQMSLEQVGLWDYRESQPADLSGGQKQKLAVAGVFAMQPSCIILDEATSMLDPRSRKELLDLLELMRQEENISIINVTHHMDEVLHADHVLVMHEGRVVLSGKPSEVFYEADLIKSLGLDVPAYVEVTLSLAKYLKKDIRVEDIESPEQATEYIKDILTGLSEQDLKNLEAYKDRSDILSHKALHAKIQQVDSEDETVLKVKNLSHVYHRGRLDQIHAIHDISFDLKKAEFLGIAGHTGSGKSTLIQHLNGLIPVQEGSIEVLGLDATKKENIPAIRKKVGMVFQYPEQQLFAETILDDVSYGPKRLGMSEEEARQSSLDALAMVGLQDIETDRSPFELSGGQMRRVAIAGILAMKPEILILDEPAAGLDPQGRDEIFTTLKALQAKGVSIIFVSHSMDDLARLADRIMVLKQGRLQALDTVDKIFSDSRLVTENDLSVPQVMLFADRIRKGIFPDLDNRLFRPEDLLYRICQEALRGGSK
jgi:energy-coupling factor transporter ATPase